MKHKFSFSFKSGKNRGIGQMLAAGVMALAIAVSGVGTTALLVSQPGGLVVAPTSIKYDSSARSEARHGRFPASSQENGEKADASSEAESDTQEQEAQPEQPAQAQQPEQEVQAQQEQTEAEPQTEAGSAQSGTSKKNAVYDASAITHENSDIYFRTETPELAAEDPLSAPASDNSNIAERAAQAMVQNAMTITPEQLVQAFREGLIDEAQLAELNSGDYDGDDGGISWLWDWLWNMFFPSEEQQNQNPEYSGWHTDEAGNTYYYTLDTHQALTGIHTIDGVLYYFNESGVKQDVVFGIDVSKYQTGINWEQVKSSGVQFVIARLGYRGYVSGTLVQDPMFEEHFNGARNAGLRVGAYVFSQAVNEDEAREEAIASAYVLNGRTLDYPLYFDSEASGATNGSGRADGLGTEDRTKCAVAFCEQVKAMGYRPGVYASTRWFQKRLDLGALTGYSIWDAHYDVVSSGIACDIWQGTYQGRVNGYASDIDVNISYIG